MKYDTIIFDMDGTLLNTLDDIMDSVNYILKNHGMPLRTYDEIRSFVGNGSADLIARVLPGGRDNSVYESFLYEYKNHYSKNMAVKTAPYDGIIEMLEELSAKNYKIAIVSNKSDPYVKELSKKYFGKYIAIAVGESEKTMAKPSPDMIYTVIKELGSGTENSVYVGDSDTDIRTAENANMPCISVSWGFRNEGFLKEHGALCIIDNPSELLEVIEGENENLSTMGI